MEETITLDTKELRKVLEYILENEANHFNEWCAECNPNDHIYMSALKVLNYLEPSDDTYDEFGVNTKNSFNTK